MFNIFLPLFRENGKSYQKSSWKEFAKWWPTFSGKLIEYPFNLWFIVLNFSMFSLFTIKNFEWKKKIYELYHSDDILLCI